MVATFRTKIFNFIKIIQLNWLAKLNLAGPLVVNIIVKHCCKQKMLKETESEETKSFLSHFYHSWHPLVLNYYGFKAGFGDVIIQQ